MKRPVILALAQPETKPISIMAGPGFLPGDQGSPVQGAPYSATIVNESTQTLADGNRIVQRTTGTTARDSQGRTRQDMALPPIGNMSAANAPHLVFIQDPVAQTAYTLDLTNKTAHKMPGPPAGAPTAAGVAAGAKIKMLAAGPVAVGGLAGPGLQAGAFIYKATVGKDQADA